MLNLREIRSRFIFYSYKKNNMKYQALFFNDNLSHQCINDGPKMGSDRRVSGKSSVNKVLVLPCNMLKMSANLTHVICPELSGQIHADPSITLPLVLDDDERKLRNRAGIRVAGQPSR